MKKTALLLVFILVMAIPVTANAALPDENNPYALHIRPTLSFDGTTANCSVTVIGENMSDSISIVMKLWQGNSCIATWSTSGKGYVQFSRSKDIAESLQYKLTADVLINGIAKPTVSAYGNS